MGATVRLEDGTLAAVPAGETAANRPRLVKSLQQREPLWLELESNGRHRTVRLGGARGGSETPLLVDTSFEDQMTAYLKSTQEWAPLDRPAPAERHFIRKKRRAAFFEARGKDT